MREAHIHQRARWGQHFLIDAQVRDRIISIVTHIGASQSDCNVWEIGIGFGALTITLTQHYKNLIGFEIDHGICRIIRPYIPHVTLIEGDVRHTYPKLIEQGNIPNIVVGNLPYNIGIDILAMLSSSPIDTIPVVTMLQKEAIARLASPHGSSTYTAHAALLQARYTIRRNFNIVPHAFYPRPHVESALATFIPHEISIDPHIWPSLAALLHYIFRSRPKDTRQHHRTRASCCPK